MSGTVAPKMIFKMSELEFFRDLKISSKIFSSSLFEKIISGATVPDMDDTENYECENIYISA